MIDLIISGLSLLVPSAGILGVAVKLLGKLLPGFSSAVAASPVTAAIAKAAEGFVDLVTWGAKGILGYAGTWLAGGFDHISKDARAFAILWAVAWVAYLAGGVGAAKAENPPAAKFTPAAATPKAPLGPKKGEQGLWTRVDEAYCSLVGGCRAK